MEEQDSVLMKIDLPTGASAEIRRSRFGRAVFEAVADHPVGSETVVREADKTAEQGHRVGRVAFVAGIRGDAPQGVEVALRLMAFLRQFQEDLDGLVDVYPCLNPLALEQGERRWPFFNVDLNRLFPGKKDAFPPSRLAHLIVSDLKASHSPADIVVELRGARPGFEESLHAQVHSGDLQATHLAQQCNVRHVWERRLNEADSMSFAHQFQTSIVLEGGTGNLLNADVGRSLYEGALNLLAYVGILPERLLPFPWAAIERPQVVDDSLVIRHRGQFAGLFLPSISVRDVIKRGDTLGEIIDPSAGRIREKIIAACDGTVMALRKHPVVSPGALLCRIVQNSSDEDVPDAIFHATQTEKTGAT